MLETIRELVIRMATENSTWGYTRICGALRNLGHDVGRSTVKRILAEHGLEPTNERSKRMLWSTFLKAHWGAIAATDFFTVEVLTRHGLVRYFVLFVIDLKTRRVEIAGISHQPHDEWMKQMARNLTDAIDGFLRDTRFLIHDRDPLFSASLRATLGAVGVETVKLPARSPNLNAYAERFVRSIKSKCLSPQSDDSVGRKSSPRKYPRFRRSLPSGEESSRPRQRAHLPAPGIEADRRWHPMSRASRRNAPIFIETRRERTGNANIVSQPVCQRLAPYQSSPRFPTAVSAFSTPRIAF
ncbi:MAG: transposase [Acidobacteria bacterium]|nr:MAG: transposase [Acidobacteriota bacterium]